MQQMSSGFMEKIKFILIFFLLSGCFASPFQATSKTRYDHPEWEFVKTAHKYLGYTEKSNRKELKSFTGVDPYYTEWCAAFVNAVLKSHGVKGSETVSQYPLTARSFTYWGERVWEPRIGDIVIFPRGNQGWQGHVGFYIETRVIDDIDYYVILGGNQNNAVTYELYPAYRALKLEDNHRFQLVVRQSNELHFFFPHLITFFF